MLKSMAISIPSARALNDTVVRVYVENIYHVKAGQTLVDLDPRDYQIAVENAAANLAQAEQSVKAAQQNYELSVANLDAAIATNVKAQLDVKRYGELLDQAVIPRETNDEIVMTGRVGAAAVNSDHAAVGAAARMIGPGPGRGAGGAGFARSGQAQPELYAYRRARLRCGR
jgi:membrane fusion protein (multidrug efflux system)